MSAMAAAPTATIECLKSVPPIRITSARWPSSAAAMVGLWVMIVTSRSPGRLRTSSRLVVPPSMKTVCPASTSFAPARPRACFSTLAMPRRPARLATVGEAGRAPPCTRVRSPSAQGRAGRGGWCLRRGSARCSSPWPRSGRPASAGRGSLASLFRQHCTKLHDIARNVTICHGRPASPMVEPPNVEKPNDDPDCRTLSLGHRG